MRTALGREQLQLESVFWLQLDDEPVRLVCAWKDRVRYRAEIDDDLRIAAGQPFTGTQVERHAGPAPVLHLGAQCDKSFAGAVRRYLGFIKVAADWLSVDRAGPVLAAHHIACNAFGGEGFQRAQHLEFFITDRIGVVGRWWFHRDHRQQLQRVVLDHVAHCASAVVKGATRADSEPFSQCDLDIGDAFAAPQRFEQGIAEAQRHQVLHRRLAEVMVDAKGLAFREYRAHHLVDLLCAGQIMAERFFKHDTHPFVVDTGSAELRTDLREQMRAGREVEHHRARLPLIQPVLQALVMLRLRQIHAPVLHQRRKALELLVIGAFRTFDFAEAFLQPGSVAVVAHFIAGDCQDPAAFR